MDSRRSEVHQHRYTSLDAAIKRDAVSTEDWRFLTVPVDRLRAVNTANY